MSVDGCNGKQSVMKFWNLKEIIHHYLAMPQKCFKRFSSEKGSKTLLPLISTIMVWSESDAVQGGWKYSKVINE